MKLQDYQIIVPADGPSCGVESLYPSIPPFFLISTKKEYFTNDPACEKII
jgi:hypothetical protein